MEILFGLIIFVADIYAIVKVINSDRDTGTKVLWTLLIAFLPIIGFVAWYFAGPR